MKGVRAWIVVMVPMLVTKVDQHIVVVARRYVVVTLVTSCMEMRMAWIMARKPLFGTLDIHMMVILTQRSIVVTQTAIFALCEKIISVSATWICSAFS
jgi:uncharacterized membrane protein